MTLINRGSGVVAPLLRRWPSGYRSTGSGRRIDTIAEATRRARSATAMTSGT